MGPSTSSSVLTGDAFYNDGAAKAAVRALNADTDFAAIATAVRVGQRVLIRAVDDEATVTIAASTILGQRGGRTVASTNVLVRQVTAYHQYQPPGFVGSNDDLNTDLAST